MKLTWDVEKAKSNIRKHGLGFEAFTRFQWTNAILRPTYPSEHGGRRLRVTGILDDDLVTAVLAPLGSEALSLISLRRASRAERREYERAQDT